MKPRPDLDVLGTKIHELNRKWWPANAADRPKAQINILIISELIECMEGERKNLMDDKLPHRKMAEVEMADTVIRVLDTMAAFGFVYRNPKEDGMTVASSKLEGVNPEEDKIDILYALVSMLPVGMYFGHKPSAVFSSIIDGCEEYCKLFGYDLWAAVDEKLEYNKNRIDHTLEHRMAEGGKKW